MLLVVALIAVPLAAFAQPSPTVFVNLDSLQNIPAPSPISIRPRLFAAYGAWIAAAMLTILYLYRGRAFIVYWIGSWLLIGASLMLLAQGYDDLRLGSVMLGRIDASNGVLTPARHELVRLAIPRRTYTQSHMDYVLEVIEAVWKRRESIPGVRISKCPSVLRHFRAEFERNPLSAEATR